MIPKQRSETIAFMSTASFLLLLAFQIFPTIAEARTAGKAIPWSANKLIQSSESVSMAVGERVPFEVGFKNTGTNAWLPDAKARIILRSKVTRESYFYDADMWLSRIAATPVTTAVPPGTIGYFPFVLHAPITAGQYHEEMYLERGGVELPGSRFVIAITVKEKTVHAPQIVGRVAVQAQKIPSEPLLASKLIQSDSSLTMPAFGRAVFEVGYKNTGTSAWQSAGNDVLTLRSSAKKESWFYDSTWQSGSVVKVVGTGAPGELVYVSFVLNAPRLPGKYTEKLALYADGKKLSGTDVAIPITVTRALPSASLASYVSAPSARELSPQTPFASTSTTTSTRANGIIEDIRDTEKSIRVGITHSNAAIQVTASKDYEVRDAAGILLGAQISGSVTTIIYDRMTKLYSVTMQNMNSTSTLPVRLVAQQSQPDIIFDILSYSNRPTWSTTINDNRFRGAIEVNYASATDRVWVINELMLEDYLKGTGETSNSSPYEFQKALMIAARTYALYHLQRGTKNAADHFIVRSTDADQVYRGYAAELRLPSVARAIAETRGVIVAYQGSLAITPYYSQSDGRTRSWEEVWGGGPYPWLRSVSDPSNAGLPMLGHGVGMSARGALLMALDGKGFEEILKYYYTGIELRKVY